MKCFFSKNFWFFGKKISLSGYFLWSIPLIIHSEHLPIQKYLVISTVALACRLIYFRESNCHVFPCLQFCVHILTFLKASSLETKWVTPNLHLKVISRLSFWLKKELVANLRKKNIFLSFLRVSPLLASILASEPRDMVPWPQHKRFNMLGTQSQRWVKIGTTHVIISPFDVC